MGAAGEAGNRRGKCYREPRMRSRAAWLLLWALPLPALFAAYAGARGPLAVRLNLGPGDGPYVTGFAAGYEVVAGTALQWSGPASRIALPLAIEGPAELVLRFGPPRGGEARVDLALGPRPLESFTCCERQAFQRHRTPVDAASPTPVQLDLRVTSPKADAMGLLLDWVELGLRPGTRVFLTGVARFRPAALVAVAAFLLVLVGFGPLASAALVAPLALALALGLRLDPWLVHRLLTWLPESLLGFGLIATALSRALTCRGLLSPAGARLAVTVALAAFTLRATCLNHPDFYHPDLMSHARRTQALRRAGLEAWLSPARYLDLDQGPLPAGQASGRTKIGLYLYRIGDALYPLPYTLAPYLPVAVLPLGYDDTITAIRLLGAAASALPIVLVAALARALRAPEWGAALFAVAPTPVVELSLASVPALVGLCFDVALLVFLAAHVLELPARALVLRGALLLAVAQLVYVSSPITSSLLLATLAAVAFSLPGLGPRVGWASLRVLALGSALAVLLYYRHFVPGAGAAVRAAVAAPTTTRPSDLGGGRLDGSLVSFALPIFLGLALVGACRLAARAEATRAVLAASFLSLLLVALLRLRVPVVFGYVHLALAATPLLCVTAAAGLQAIGSRKPHGPWIAALLALVLFAQGTVLQAQAFLATLGRAR